MKIYLLAFITALTLFSVGCEGESGESKGSFNNGMLKLETQYTILDPSKRKFYLETKLTTLYPEGSTLTISNISFDIAGCSITSSSLWEKDLLFNDGQKSNILKVVFNFRTPCQPKRYTLKGDTHSTYRDTTHRAKYISEEQNISIDANSTIGGIDSEFELVAVDGESDLRLNETKRYRLVVKEGNSTHPNSLGSVFGGSVESITLKTLDSSKLTFIEPSKYRSTLEVERSSLEFETLEDVELYLRTQTFSGSVGVDLTIKYFDTYPRTINQRLYLTIFSSEPTLFSISPAGLSYNQNTKWFEESFLVSATDKYGNVVNRPAQLSISTMADFRDRDGVGETIVYGKSSPIKGSLIADSEVGRAIFKANRSIFENINPKRDFLFIFGDVTATEALGKWDIELYSSGGYTLNLMNKYYGKSYDNLGFAVGHSYIRDICSEEFKEWEIKVDSPNGIYELDDNGEAHFKLKFPPYLIGKRVAVGVNYLGESRAGEVHFETLRSPIKPPPPIEIDMNSSESVKFTHIYELEGTGSDTIYIRNAKVRCSLKSENIEILSMQENGEIRNYSECNGEDRAFIQLEVTLKDINSSGSLSFERCELFSFDNLF